MMIIVMIMIMITITITMINIMIMMMNIIIMMMIIMCCRPRSRCGISSAQRDPPPGGVRQQNQNVLLSKL